MQTICSIKIQLFLILLVVGSLSCSKEIDYNHRTAYFKNSNSSLALDSTISCVTFNIHLGFQAGKDPWDVGQTGAGMDQVKNIANLLRTLSPQPDIIALQEVPRNKRNAIVKDFLEQLAEELSYNYAFGAHGYNDAYDGTYPVEGEWGNAILTRFEILAINNVETEYHSQWERRSMLDVSLKLNDTRIINALSLHHLPSPVAIPNTKSYVEVLETPVVLMGDFNNLGIIPELDSIGLNDVDTTGMYLHGIDRFFVSGTHFEVDRIGSLGRVYDGVYVSDHEANYVFLQLN